MQNRFSRKNRKHLRLRRKRWLVQIRQLQDRRQNRRQRQRRWNARRHHLTYLSRKAARARENMQQVRSAVPVNPQTEVRQRARTVREVLPAENLRQRRHSRRQDGVLVAVRVKWVRAQEVRATEEIRVPEILTADRELMRSENPISDLI